MKKSDIAMLILIISISLTISYFVGNSLINTKENRSVNVEVINPISAELPLPDPEVFVEDYVNPTELIKIGNSNNKKPFSDGDQ